MKKRIKRLTVPKRRRREGKTDYKARLYLLKSGIPRLVVRKSNMYITAQIVTSSEAQDKVMCAVNSKELAKRGWKGSKKNLPAAYLTGLLLATKAADKDIKKAILDIGLHRSTKGSWIYACVKGIVDAGLEIAHKKEMLPKEERIMGKHIKEELANEFDQIKSKLILLEKGLTQNQNKK